MLSLACTQNSYTLHATVSQRAISLMSSIRSQLWSRSPWVTMVLRGPSLPTLRTLLNSKSFGRDPMILRVGFLLFVTSHVAGPLSLFLTPDRCQLFHSSKIRIHPCWIFTTSKAEKSCVSCIASRLPVLKKDYTCWRPSFSWPVFLHSLSGNHMSGEIPNELEGIPALKQSI